MMVFALASIWPDEIKHDPQYKTDVPEGGNRPDGPACAENIGYSDLRKHMYWHFADQPFSSDHSKLPPCSTPNIGIEIDVMSRACL